MINEFDHYHANVEIDRHAINAKSWSILPPEVLELLKECHVHFETERKRLLKKRQLRKLRFKKGQVPHFFTHKEYHAGKLDEKLVKSAWKIGPLPKDILDRRVEITGPVNNSKMVINMLNGTPENGVANMAMLDFEDSMKPTWENVIDGVHNVIGAVRGDLKYVQPASQSQVQRTHTVNKGKTAHVIVRVRGLHLNEDHVHVNGHSISAGLFDLVLTAYHAMPIQLASGKTPMYYIPKCEHHLEARWWNTVFSFVEEKLSFPKNSLRTTFLIETLPAAFQMEEILFEVRERATGLNVGRWDKIFSDIKVLSSHSDRVIADRSFIDMTRAWMDKYARLLVQICHKHGAFAMGGMSASTPGKDEKTRSVQIGKIVNDKKREANLGHDGCWVSHPYFINSARSEFKSTNQLDFKSQDVLCRPDLLPSNEGPKTLVGLRTNIRVAVAFQFGWNQGFGCISLDNLMEDLATLEISRAQVWQWLHHKVELDDGTTVTAGLIRKLFSEEAETLINESIDEGNPDSQENRDLKKSLIRASEEAFGVFTLRELCDFYSEALVEWERQKQKNSVANSEDASSSQKVVSMKKESEVTEDEEDAASAFAEGGTRFQFTCRQGTHSSAISAPTAFAHKNMHMKC